MATCTALTNVVGNTVAVFVVARWEGAFDRAKFDRYMTDQASGRIRPSGAEERGSEALPPVSPEPAGRA